MFTASANPSLGDHGDMAFTDTATSQPRSTQGASIHPLLQHARPPVQVCPPRRMRHGAWWHRLMRWLAAPSPLGAAPDTLSTARQEFDDALADLPSDAAYELRDRIAMARSLRELWHLRAAVHELVARRHDQAEAGRRLAVLNRHFPTRAPLSGFAPLHQ